MRHPNQILTVNLDEATHASIIAAACAVMLNKGARALDLGEWRRDALTLDHSDLLHRASELGIRFVKGNRPYELPEQRVES